MPIPLAFQRQPLPLQSVLRLRFLPPQLPRLKQRPLRLRPLHVRPLPQPPQLPPRLPRQLPLPRFRRRFQLPPRLPLFQTFSPFPINAICCVTPLATIVSSVAVIGRAISRR